MGWILAAVLLAGCGQQDARFEQDAKETVAAFQRQADAKAYDTLYDTTAPAFRARATQDEFGKMLAIVDRAMGARQASTFVRREAAVSDDDEPLTRLVYETTFAKGQGEEFFYFVVDGDTPTLYRYEIESPVLEAFLADAEPVFDDAFGTAVLAYVVWFQEQRTRGEYHAIYEAGAADMKAGVTPDAFAQTLRTMHDKLGALKDTTPKRRTTGQSDSGIPLTVVEMGSRFEKGQATERFYLQYDAGQALLYRYEFLSPALITVKKK